MIKDYIVNSFILISFISVVYQLFTNSGLNPTLVIHYRLLSGGIFGLLGITLIIFGVQLPNNIIVDFRNIAIFLSAITGGWVSAATSAFIISAFRLLFYGINSPSIVAVTIIFLLIIIFCLITRLKIKVSLKWLFSIGISEILSSIAFSILIDDAKLLKNTISSYCFGLSFISILLYYYVEYIEAVTESFRNYKQEAHRDFLTGLNNVRQFDKLFNRIVGNGYAGYDTVSLLYIDIDFFKKVNDTYGHREGDIVLKELGEILTKACRSVDIVSRNGGEEFSVILPNCPTDVAIEIAERIRKKVEATPIALSNQLTINITVSIGIASYPVPVSDFGLLRESADMALYEAKRSGRNKVISWS